MIKSKGELKTPNWPDEKYPPGTSCSWLIMVEPDMVSSTLTPNMGFVYSYLIIREGLIIYCNISVRYQVIQVKFDKFLVEADPYCRFDYVAFFNGGDKDDSRLIGKYCGDQNPQ